VGNLPGLESRGPEGFKQVAAAFLTGFPDSKLTIDDLIAEDDRVVVRFTVRGTHLGDFAGIAPTNRQIALPVIMVNQISHGKMSESWEVVDQLGLFQALGSFPPAAATA
jgi:predicted ester cyclase